MKTISYLKKRIFWLLALGVLTSITGASVKSIKDQKEEQKKENQTISCNSDADTDNPTSPDLAVSNPDHCLFIGCSGFF